MSGANHTINMGNNPVNSMKEFDSKCADDTRNKQKSGMAAFCL